MTTRKSWNEGGFCLNCYKFSTTDGQNQFNSVELTLDESFSSMWEFWLFSNFFRNLSYFENFFKTKIFLKFALLSNSNLLNKHLASDLLSEAAIIFYKLTNFKKNDIDTDTDTKLVAGTRLPIPARIRVLYYDKKGVKTPKIIEILKLEKIEIEKSKNRQIENFKSWKNKNL